MNQNQNQNSRNGGETEIELVKWFYAKEGSILLTNQNAHPEKVEGNSRTDVNVKLLFIFVIVYYVGCR